MPDSRTAKSAAVEVGNVSATYSSKSPVNRSRRARWARTRSRGDRGVEQADLERSRGQLLDLDEHAGGLAVEVPPPTIFTLTSASWPFAEVGHGVGPALRAARTGPCRSWCVPSLVLSKIQAFSPYLSAPKSSDAQAHLLGRAERRGHGRSSRWRPSGPPAGTARWPAKPAGWSYCRPNDATNGGDVHGADVVRRDATAGEERLEVDRRALDGALRRRPTRPGRP